MSPLTSTHRLLAAVGALVVLPACFEREPTSAPTVVAEVEAEIAETDAESTAELATESAEAVEPMPETAPETDPEPPDPRDWKRHVVRQSEPDVLRPRPLMALESAPELPPDPPPAGPIVREGDTTTIYEGVEPETDPACFFRPAARIAEVEIEGVVREYIPVLPLEWRRAEYPAVAVFRMKVIRTLYGRELPSVVYAAADTAVLVLRNGARSIRRNGASYMKQGMRGLATFGLMGYDPIRKQSAQFDETVLDGRVPARVLQLGSFFPVREDGRWSAELSAIQQRLLPNGVTEDQLAEYISRFSSMTCNASPVSPCTRCETSDTCTGGAPCSCVYSMVGCRELPPEEPDRCNLYPETPYTPPER